MRISTLLFTNVPLDELEEDTGSIFSTLEDNEVCYLCRKGFSLMNKKYSCSNCKMPICVAHSIFFDMKSRICDNCTHESLVEEVWAGKKKIKDQIIKNIQRSVKESEEKEEIIKKEDIHIEKLRVELEGISSKAILEENILQDEIEKLIQENNSEEKNIEKTINDSKKSQNSEMNVVEKMAKAQEHLQILHIEMEESLQERQELDNIISHFSDDNLAFEVNELRQKLCKICKLRLHFANNSHSACPELSQNICTCLSF